MRPPRVAAGALAAATTFALAGCGSSSLSASDLRARASAICAQANARTSRIGTPSSASQIAAFLGQGAAAYAAELRKLRMLAPPASATAAYRQATSELSVAVTLLRQAQSAIDHGSEPGSATQHLQTALTPVNERENAAWRGLGIPACVNR